MALAGGVIFHPGVLVVLFPHPRMDSLEAGWPEDGSVGQGFPKGTGKVMPAKWCCREICGVGRILTGWTMGMNYGTLVLSNDRRRA